MFPMRPSNRRDVAILVVLATLTLPLKATGPVTFAFRVPADGRNPFAREVWAEVKEPDGRMLRLPAYFDDEDRYAVRVAADILGTYRLAAVSETIEGRERPLLVAPPPAVVVVATMARPFVRLDPRDAHRFATSDSGPYVPIGVNLAWPPTGGVEFYQRAFAAGADAGLNWTRVWMAHWSGFNLDWLPANMGSSPKPGYYDRRVAVAWDNLLALAETHGLYVQVVLQHHGQYSSKVNPNWNENPWNAAQPGGFLAKPADFFTSAQARALTKQKYRYVVARWAWSPMVLAWELFNEVQWVDALRLDKDEAAVAAWHAEMADYLRSIDVYHHLVTTSMDNLRSPIYARMDYYQPHRYAPNMLAALRQLTVPATDLPRPVFYGEFGVEKMPIDRAVRDTGLAYGPLTWASLGSGAMAPAQAWPGAELLGQGRLADIGAVGRFLVAARWAARGDLAPFAPAVESGQRIPLVVTGAQEWQRRSVPEITIPRDGSEPAALADVPRLLVGRASNIAEGYPARVGFRLGYDRATTARVRGADTESEGATLRVTLDGATMAEYVWPARMNGDGSKRPAELVFNVPAGEHAIALENTGGADRIELTAFDTGLEAPVLAAAGRRNRDFVFLWVWHRTGVLAAPTRPVPGRATLVIPDVPAGEWRLVWWNTRTGAPDTTSVLQHKGGTLRLDTPPIDGHEAVTLERTSPSP